MQFVLFHKEVLTFSYQKTIGLGNILITLSQSEANGYIYHSISVRIEEFVK